MKVQDKDLAYLLSGDQSEEAINKRLCEYVATVSGHELETVQDVISIFRQIGEKMQELVELQQRLKRLGLL